MSRARVPENQAARAPAAWPRYGIALACVLVAFLIRLALAPILAAETPFLIFLSATTMAAWYGGVGPGLLATVAGLVITDVIFLPPTGVLSPLDRQQGLLFALFGIEGTFISLLAGRLRTAWQRLREREARMAAILDAASDAIVTVDPAGIIESVNPGVERLFGYTPADLIGHNVKMLMPPPFREEHDGYLARYARTGRKRVIGASLEIQGRRKDGAVFPADLAVSEFEDQGRHMFAGILRDLSTRNALEREVLEVASLERRQIGQELHDTAAQELTALGLLVDRLRTAFSETSAERQIVTKIAAGLKRALGQVRTLARGMIHLDVGAEGLVSALTELAAQTTELHGISCTFVCDGPVLAADRVATQFHGIAREATANALRHAQPRKIELILRQDGPLLTLRIEDDGSGFVEPPLEHGGMGLKIMRYRARLIQAHLSIAPREPSGTTVICTLNKDAHHDERDPCQQKKGDDQNTDCR